VRFFWICTMFPPLGCMWMHVITLYISSSMDFEWICRDKYVFSINWAPTCELYREYYLSFGKNSTKTRGKKVVLGTGIDDYQHACNTHINTFFSCGELMYVLAITKNIRAQVKFGFYFLTITNNGIQSFPRMLNRIVRGTHRIKQDSCKTQWKY
jgi:hypothetical protein